MLNIPTLQWFGGLENCFWLNQANILLRVLQLIASPIKWEPHNALDKKKNRFSLLVWRHLFLFPTLFSEVQQTWQVYTIHSSGVITKRDSRYRRRFHCMFRRIMQIISLWKGNGFLTYFINFKWELGLRWSEWKIITIYKRNFLTS